MLANAFEIAEDVFPERNVFVADLRAATDEECLSAYKITDVVDVRASGDPTLEKSHAG